jgi:hypothetical protein
MAFLIGRHKKFLWIVALCELFQSIDGPRKKLMDWNVLHWRG